MLSGSGLVVFLLMLTSRAHCMAQPCVCMALPHSGLQVNCSSLRLTELPHLPSDTVELHVQDNQLTTVSPGLFDRLVSLKKVSLSGNPFRCDCRIQYLRNWLLKNMAAVSKEPTCASPSSVAQRRITELSDDFFSSCAQTSCTGGAYNAVIGLTLLCLIVILMWSLRLAKKSAFTLNINKGQAGLKADSLRSQRPKHSSRPSGMLGVGGNSEYLTWTVDQQRPLINMEILPEVLDVLHKKHNIKIKAS
ncbi:platelet glycoprotein IX [Genypterus blacodes]|uniref:platelet glycoprotein IX n=1 Tax=Genypterus blacodes TaxID=154954 RepID=UPI003F76D9F6